MSHSSGNRFVWLPNLEQELLLKAGLVNDPSAITAWQAWKNIASPESVCEADLRLFPLVYHNLQKLGYSDEATGDLKREHRNAYRDTRSRLQTAEIIATEFRNNGIRTILLKGTALAMVYYESIALRPMSDVDLLIKRGDLSKAVEVLHEMDWHPEDVPLPLATEIMNACHFFKPSGDNEVDLHWQLMRDCWNADKIERIWESAVPLEYNTLNAETLCSTDHLFHTCCHGARYNPVSPIRWVSDALMILASPFEIDWERLYELGKFHRLNLLLFHSLSYLKETFEAPVPEEYLRRVWETRKAKLEKMSFRFFSEEPSAWTTKRYVQELAFQYSTLRGRSFVKYLQFLTFERLHKGRPPKA